MDLRSGCSNSCCCFVLGCILVDVCCIRKDSHLYFALINNILISLQKVVR